MERIKIMDLETYQKEARVTATFVPHFRLAYPALEIINEFGEFIDKYEDYDCRDITDDDLISEAGDILWAMSLICDFYEINLSELTKSVVFMSTEDMYSVLSKIAGVAKKVIRDNNLNRDKMIELLNDFKRGFNDLVNDLGVTMEDVAAANIKKLRDRQARNVIKGEGDKR